MMSLVGEWQAKARRVIESCHFLGINLGIDFDRKELARDSEA
jgi:hypothetical protein